MNHSLVFGEEYQLRAYYVPSIVGTLCILPHSSKQPHMVCINTSF